MMFRVLLFLFSTTLPVIASRPALPEPIVDCSHIGDGIFACVPFLKGAHRDPSPSCCRGVKAISKTTLTDKIGICGCIKDALSRQVPYDASLLPKLPGKCGVNYTLPPIDQKYDCKKKFMFHISDSNDDSRHEKQDGIIHAGIKANYIHQSILSENYKNIIDVPMNVENDGMAHDGMVSDNYKYIQGIPMTEEKNRMAHKRMVSENYENIQHVPMTEEHDRMVAKGTVSENYVDIKHVHMIEEHDRMVPENTISKNYKYNEDVPMTEEKESITSKGMVSKNYN